MAVIRMPPPVTADSVEAVKLAQHWERVGAVAALLASFHDVVLTDAPASTRAHYLTIADAAVFGASRAKGLRL